MNTSNQNTQLPSFINELFMVYGSFGRHNGWMLVRTSNKRAARKIANQEWLDQGRVDQVLTLKEDAKDYGFDSIEEYIEDHDYLEIINNLTEVGKWEEIEWGS